MIIQDMKIQIKSEEILKKELKKQLLRKSQIENMQSIKQFKI